MKVLYGLRVIFVTAAKKNPSFELRILTNTSMVVYMFNVCKTISDQPEFPKEIPPAACKVPSFCPSDSGAVCPQGGSIPKCIITCRGRRRK